MSDVCPYCHGLGEDPKNGWVCDRCEGEGVVDEEDEDES